MAAEDDCSGCCRSCMITAAFCLILAGFLCIVLGDRDPLYSAAIRSVSGLDEGDLGRRPADLSPLFNVTLRVTTRSIFSSGCTHPGAVMEVTYAGVKLTTTAVQPFCARPRKAKDVAVEAWGMAVQVPGFALDRLAADARRGLRVFDVDVTMPGNHQSRHHGKLVSCVGLHVGEDDGAALGAPCTVSDVDTVMAVPSGKDGGGTS
uniref:Uncharacterized protein n=1 Tax=Avena sativa TaxID=4498 RepID=A0ACD5Z0T1_AVESA